MSDTHVAPRTSREKRRPLVDVLVVSVVVASLAAFALPRFRAARADERVHRAIDWLYALHSAEEHQRALHHAFTADLGQLAPLAAVPEGFVARPIEITRDGWRITLEREGARGGTLVCDERGIDRAASTIDPARLECGE